MAVVLNGVLVSRETGSLLPSSFLNKLKVSNCVINTAKIDSGDMKINDSGFTPILPNKNNLPLVPNNEDWSIKTSIYANFNGDLEGGPSSLYGKEIDSLAIRRSSNRDNFSRWEDIRIIEDIRNTVDENNEYSFDDKAIESGVWYMYAMQPIASTYRGSMYKSEKEIIIYDSAFLVGKDGKQLNLKYDTSVASLKRNIKESRVETIGGKYPFITRNANTDYKEFQLTGLITHFMDESEDFAPKAELFLEDDFKDGALDMTYHYNKIYENNDINNYNNTTLEREFRQKVEDFLVDGNPKLFKSPKVGNVLVRLMDVNLSSRQEINGGMIYTFSCTAVEIDDCSLESLDRHNIQKR